jgi:hypothetical protein
MNHIKLILIYIVLFTISCKKIETTPLPIVTTNPNIFNANETTVTNGSEIVFELKTAGVYTLTISDYSTNEIISKERFTGKVGINKMKIYTKSISVRYLYLLLEDVTRNEIGKTKIIIK